MTIHQKYGGLSVDSMPAGASNFLLKTSHLYRFGIGDQRPMLHLFCNRVGTVVLPEGVTTIAAYAFKACSRLNKVSIPAGVTRIEDGAFGWWTEELVIHAPAGSYAIQYAKKMGFRYRSKKEK